ncbi:hypothetical protein C8J56DRAFT_1001987 [Mycena floridula]|nr:hypothetical protein C8J56DRAFT_1001987 [Mycena floridula]
MRSNKDWEVLISSQISRVLAETTSASLTAGPAANLTIANEDFTATIDHTLLKPDATPSQIDELCSEAIKYNFKSCCVNGTNVKQVADRLRGSKTIPCVVIGFPLGASNTRVKAFEAQEAVSDGAEEIDMVINIGALKAKNYCLVYDDIAAVVSASRPAIVKVIIETVFLNDEQKIAGSYLAAEAGVAFVKTCTGFLGGGATAADVALMKRTVSYKPEVKVKASAGIRSFEKCLEMFKAGADRIGSSSGAAIMANVDGNRGTY